MELAYLGASRKRPGQRSVLANLLRQTGFSLALVPSAESLPSDVWTRPATPSPTDQSHGCSSRRNANGVNQIVTDAILAHQDLEAVPRLDPFGDQSDLDLLAGVEIGGRADFAAHDAWCRVEGEP